MDQRRQTTRRTSINLSARLTFPSLPECAARNVTSFVLKLFSNCATFNRPRTSPTPHGKHTLLTSNLVVCAVWGEKDFALCLVTRTFETKFGKR